MSNHHPVPVLPAHLVPLEPRPAPSGRTAPGRIIPARLATPGFPALLASLVCSLLLLVPLSAQGSREVPIPEAWQGWSAWSRSPGALKASGVGTGEISDGTSHDQTSNPAAGAKAAADQVAVGQSPAAAVRLTHTDAKQDWAFSNPGLQAAQTGEVWKFSARVLRIGPSAGSISLEAVTRDRKDRVLDWQAGSLPILAGTSWQTFETRLVVPAGCTSFQVRFSGRGIGTWLIDSPTLSREREAFDWHSLTACSVSNNRITLSVDPASSLLSLRTPRRDWQFDLTGLLMATRSLSTITREGNQAISLVFMDSAGKDVRVEFRLEDDRIRMTTTGEGRLDNPQAIPGPLLAESGDSWILPINQGVLVPAADPYFRAWDLEMYGGHGLCMPFFGLQDEKDAIMVMVDTPDDAKVHFNAPETTRADSSVADTSRPASTPSRFSLLWEPSRGAWSYARTAWLVPLEGDYNQVAKEYRLHAASQGKAVTLREKAAKVPAVAKLKGAVNLWWWKNGPWWETDTPQGVLAFVRELKAAGVDRVLWSHEQDGPTVKALADAGFLPGRYDIYQDVWGPDNPNKYVNHEGWPDDLVLDRAGTPIKGWVDRDSKGNEYPGGAICSLPAIARAKTRIAADLKDHPYGARFIDTTTASSLRECWNPRHPESRSDDRKAKMELLGMLGTSFGLVAGSETGFDAAVPYLDYFEGMMSLGPWRLPDSGYDLFTYKKPDEDFRRFQTGSFYRIPLFELVWHDCVANSWYWGDASNRVPELWDERDMLNALYGTLPLWALDPKIWKAQKSRFIQSYRNATPVSFHTAWSAMTSHHWLKADHTVQETRFDDGTRVVANFGPAPWQTSDGQTIPARAFLAIFGEGTSLRSWQP